LKELVRKSISETEVRTDKMPLVLRTLPSSLRSVLVLTYHCCFFQELKRFPTLASDIAAAANEALERFRDESRKTVLRLVDMESSYLTVEFFRKLHLEPEKEKPNPRNAPAPNADPYSDNHFRKIGTCLSRLPLLRNDTLSSLCLLTLDNSGSNVSAYINMVCDTLRNSLPKAVVYCQVREAKRSLLNFFYAQVGRKEVNYIITLWIILLPCRKCHAQIENKFKKNDGAEGEAGCYVGRRPTADGTKRNLS